MLGAWPDSQGRVLLHVDSGASALAIAHALYPKHNSETRPHRDGGVLMRIK